MAMTEQEMIVELDKIKNHAFDIKSYFDLLFAQLLAEKSVKNDKVFISDKLIVEENLEEQLEKEYPGKDYVILMYAHQPHSPLISHYFPKEPRAHTSLLLCKVNGNKIEHLLNVDGQSFTSYIDILGERPGAFPHPNIKQRLVLKAVDSDTDPTSKKALHRISWENMNSVLYAFTFAERILELFTEQSDVMNNLFPMQKMEKISPESLFFLEEGILEGMVGKYVRKSEAHYIYDLSLSQKHHSRIRDHLAKSYEKLYAKTDEPINLVADEVIFEEKLRSTPEQTAYPEPASSNRSKVDTSDKSEVQNESSNYNFLLNVGITFSATLSLATLIVVGLAIAAIISCSPAELIVVTLAGVLSGMIAYGLFKTKNVMEMENNLKQEQSARY